MLTFIRRPPNLIFLDFPALKPIWNSLISNFNFISNCLIFCVLFRFLFYLFFSFPFPLWYFDFEFHFPVLSTNLHRTGFFLHSQFVISSVGCSFFYQNFSIIPGIYIILPSKHLVGLNCKLDPKNMASWYTQLCCIKFYTVFLI